MNLILILADIAIFSVLPISALWHIRSKRFSNTERKSL